MFFLLLRRCNLPYFLSCPCLLSSLACVCYYQKYVENVKQDTNIGTNILRVSASDEDADNNGAIVYNLTAYNSQDLEYFTILPESGWIVLIKPLDVSVKINSFSMDLFFF